MPLSVRLDDETQEVLDRTARILETSKTEVVRRSIRDYCARTLKDRGKRPYELIRDLVGTEASGRGDLSTRGEEILRERFARKA